MNCTFDIVAKKSLFNPRSQRLSPHQLVVMKWGNRTLLHYTTCGNDNCHNLFGKYLGNI